MTDPAIVRAKITPPPVREATLARDRLLAWLDANITRRVITVTADTGYGKTTLLADFARRTEARCLWYRLDKADRDWVAFLNYLVAAGREFVPGLGASTLGMLQAAGNPEPPLDHVLSTFIAELDALATQPTVLVLDDYHLVDATPDIRTTLTRLITDAPGAMSFVMLSRRKPRLALGRLAAQGRVATLDSGDLRFSPAETESLFRDAYHLPLEKTVLAQVEQRTEGWAASLQMLGSSLQGRSPEAVRRVVENMTGAEGGVYEYLAEEVLAELEPALQRFLTVTAILETVTPGFARAILTADPLGPGEEAIERWTREAHQEGLMARRDAFGAGERYHPLFRDLLLRHLRQTTSEKEIRGMHVRVARAAEDSDWLASSRHYSHAGSEADAVRVLSSNVTNALGTGLWGEAAELIHDLRAPEDDPRLAVVLAREDIYRGRPDAGLDRLLGFDLAALDSATRALLVQARIHALWWLGRTGELIADAAQNADDPSIPGEARAIAQAIAVTAASTTDGRLDRAAAVLEQLAEAQEWAGHFFYSGVSRHNLLFVVLNQGDYDTASEHGRRALDQFARVPRVVEEAYSARFGIARSLLESGRLGEGRAELDRATDGSSMGAIEQWFEAAGQLAILGEHEASDRLLRRAEIQPTGRVPQNVAAGALSKARLLVSLGRPQAADPLLGATFEHLPATSVCSWLSWLEVATIVALTTRDLSRARRSIDCGTDLAERQGSGLYLGRFRLLAALAEKDGRGARAAIASATEMDLLVTADAIASSLGIPGVNSERIRTAVEGRPGRWLPALRHVAAGAGNPAAEPAAALLDEFGELSDVAMLRALAKSRSPGLRGSTIGRNLARRRSPKLRVHDLGRTQFRVGDRTVEVASIRRRAAAILCYLLARSGNSATKDQVIDALWPGLDPEAGANSLHQSLYFLRREIEPGYQEDVSAHYVRFDGDLLWLDPDLVTSDSLDFHRAVSASAARTSRAPLPSLQEAALLYRGRFAPEFEYDDWSSGWRDLLHTEYLQTVESLMKELIATDRTREALAVACEALSIDPSAERVEVALIRLYTAMNLRSAAAEQYSHYAATQRSEYGVEACSLDELLDH